MPLNVWLVIRDIRCSDDTEEGKDELYMLLAGSVGEKQFSGRHPDFGLRHWSIRDNNQLKVVNYTAHHAVIPDGGAMYAQFFASEADGQKPADTIKAAAKIAQKIPNPYTVAVGAILDLVPIPTNNDDLIGTFSVKVMADGATEWAAGEDTVLQHSANDTVMVVHCTGSSTKYWFKVEVVRG